ncbi:MAG: UvrD-helicase domain-containing protein [Bacteroidales bacterium]
MSKFADEEEIKYAHSIFLDGKDYYDEQAIKVIECDETVNIDACPGSGKTTTLLAKLAILANRMPLPENQGICVLTHTNVAIDEIKKRLGSKSDILFKYPNFFGTIQSFVDKYLAIPSYVSKYKKKPLWIDDDIFISCFEKSFWSHYSFVLKKNELASKLSQYVKANSSFFKNTRLFINGGEFDLINIESNNIFEFNKPGRARQYIDWTEDEKKKMKEAAFEILKNTFDYYSVLSYNDAFLFAEDYFEENPNVKNIFTSRFKYVFVDEAQDTDDKQNKIIKDIFSDSTTILQRFGDINQSIFNEVKSENTFDTTNSLPLTNSHRFGEDIALPLRTICISVNSSLKGSDKIFSLKPVIIVFENLDVVLKKYAEIICTKKIGEKTILDIAKEEQNNSGNKTLNIKAVGWVGEPNKDDRESEKLTIKSYYSSFNKRLAKKEKVNYNSLKSFIRKTDSTKIKDYSNKILDSFVYILSLANKTYEEKEKKKKYSKTKILSVYEEWGYLDSLNYLLVKWSKEIINNSEDYNENTLNEIRRFLRKYLLTHFCIEEKKKPYITSFIDSDDTMFVENGSINTNMYRDETNDLDIELSTIHSVKGETHIATLYLETCYQGKHESERLKDQITGNVYIPPKKIKDTYKKEALKMAYVGMSRAKYLLCFAVHKDRFNNLGIDDSNGIWDIDKSLIQ